MQSDVSPGEPFSITPSDSVDLATPIRALIISAGGTVKITKLDGVTTDTLTLPAGQFAIKVRRIWATGTTATGLTGIA